MDIRRKAKENGVCLWQIGDKMGLHDSNFSRMLRKELPEEKKEKIFQLIDKIAQEEE